VYFRNHILKVITSSEQNGHYTDQIQKSYCQWSLLTLLVEDVSEMSLSYIMGPGPALFTSVKLMSLCEHAQIYVIVPIFSPEL
jgi:hypothetical protein